MAARLPIQRPDLTVGPTLSREARVLAVARDHPLADREHVSLEDIANYEVAPITDSPRELIDAAFPRRAPSGRPIRRRATRPRTPHELTALIARGKIVHPTVASFATYFGQPGIKYIPIRDLPPMKSGLVFRRRASDPRLREFLRLTRVVLAAARRAPQPPPGGESPAR